MGNPYRDGSGSGSIAEFRRQMLETLPTLGVKMAIAWSNDVTRREDLPVRKSFDPVGTKGRFLKASAINDYAFNVPIRYFFDHPGHLGQEAER